MDKQAEIALFTEELWANMVMMRANSELTAGNVLQAWEWIQQRLLRERLTEIGEMGTPEATGGRTEERGADGGG